MRSRSALLGVLALIAGVATAGAVLTPSANAVHTPGAAQASVQSYVVGTSGHRAHIMATPRNAAQLAANTTTNMVYNGGPVMRTHKAYVIFWNPGALQSGSATGFSGKYVATIKGYFF